MSLNEFTPQQIKLAILKHLKAKHGGDYKYNIIGKADAPIGAIEEHFKLRFTNEQRHIASRCFDELRAEDLIRPTYGGNSNPEDWVDITNAGLAALESGRFNAQPTAATDIHLFRLKLLFIMADGSERKALVLTEVFKNENMSEADVWKEASYMKGEGWIQILSSNGPPRVRLTHEGVKKAIDTPVFSNKNDVRIINNVTGANTILFNNDKINVEPPEIKESLGLFKSDHPDPRKVAFIMMRFGDTSAHEKIVAGIQKALDLIGVTAVRADGKQYHDDLSA